MELTAQPWAAVERLSPSSLLGIFLEDTFSVSDWRPTRLIEKFYSGHGITVPIHPSRMPTGWKTEAVLLRASGSFSDEACYCK